MERRSVARTCDFWRPGVEAALVRTRRKLWMRTEPERRTLTVAWEGTKQGGWAVVLERAAAGGAGGDRRGMPWDHVEAHPNPGRLRKPITHVSSRGEERTEYRLILKMKLLIHIHPQRKRCRN